MGKKGIDRNQEGQAQENKGHPLKGFIDRTETRKTILQEFFHGEAKRRDLSPFS